MIRSARTNDQFIETARQGAAVLGPGTPAAARPENAARFLDFVSEHLVHAAEQDRDVTVLFRAYARNVTGDPRRTRTVFVEVIGVSARLEQQHLARRARRIDLIRAAAEAAAARGEAAPRDYRLADTAFIGGVKACCATGAPAGSAPGWNRSRTSWCGCWACSARWAAPSRSDALWERQRRRSSGPPRPARRA